MGLAGWKDRNEWPISWIQTVESIKIFGIHFCPTVQQTINTSWQHCLEKFRKCLFAWRARSLPLLSQRACVLNTFATSKLWYLAQVLPLPKPIAAALEGQIRVSGSPSTATSARSPRCSSWWTRLAYLLRSPSIVSFSCGRGP